MKRSLSEHSSRSGGGAGRPGALMVEMVICCVLLTAFTAMLVPGVASVHQQRKQMRFDVLALIELNNAAAKIRAESPAQPSEVSVSELSRWFLQRYPDAELTVTEFPSDNSDALIDPFQMQAVQLSISRSVGQSGRESRRNLTVWLPQRQAAELRTEQADDEASGGPS